MFTNNSNNDVFPKTLLIRNHEGGMIWQVYHVNNIKEAEILSRNATANGFMSIILTDYDNDYEETFPNWRSNCTKELMEVFN